MEETSSTDNSKNGQRISIPPHSNTRKRLTSKDRSRSIPTIFLQCATSSEALQLAEVQLCSSSSATPLKIMNTRVITSGEGDISRGAASSYEACGRKRNARCWCFKIEGSQYLQKIIRIHKRQWILNTNVINEVRASVWRPKAAKALSRYGVIMATGITTEFSSLRTASLGLKCSTRSRLDSLRSGDAGGESGTVASVLRLIVRKVS